MDITTNIPNTNFLQDSVTKLQESNLDEKLKEEQQLKDVCADFEAIFIHMMLKSGRSTVPDSGFIEKSNGTKMFEDMYDQEMATAMSKSEDGGIGIAKMLYEQMKLGLNNRRVSIEEINNSNSEDIISE